MEKLWFKRKRYGYGWTPATYQGWVLVLVYILSMAFLANLTKHYTKTNDIIIGFFIPVLVITALFLIVTRIKGEKPRWQWGEEKK